MIKNLNIIAVPSSVWLVLGTRSSMQIQMYSTNVKVMQRTQPTHWNMYFVLLVALLNKNIISKSFFLWYSQKGIISIERTIFDESKWDETFLCYFKHKISLVQRPLLLGCQNSMRRYYVIWPNDNLPITVGKCMIKNTLDQWCIFRIISKAIVGQSCQ